MAQLEPPRTRTVLEPLSHFDLSSPSSSSLRSLALSPLSHSQTLIYVGNDSGTLILLSLNPNYTPKSDPSSSPNSSLGFADADAFSENVSVLRQVFVGNSPIEGIHVLAQIGKVLVLSNGFLFLLDLLLLNPVKKLSLLKGITAVSRRIRSSKESESTDLSNLPMDNVNLMEYSSRGHRFLQKLGSGIIANGGKTRLSDARREGGGCAVAVLIGKRLLLVEFFSDREADSSNGQFLVLKEIQCIDEVKTMVWINDSIIVGTSSGYSLFSCVTGQCALICSLPEPCSLPQLKLLWKEWKVLMLVDNVGVVVNDHGQPVGGSLVFHGAPAAIGEMGLYVVTVKDGKVELYHKKTGKCVQRVMFAGEGAGPCLVADEEDRSGKVVAVATSSKDTANAVHKDSKRLYYNKGLVDINEDEGASEDTYEEKYKSNDGGGNDLNDEDDVVICYRKVPSEDQIKDLLRKKNFKEAISLVEELESEGEMTNEMSSFVHAQVGFLLLFDLHFEEAINHFLQSETMQPSEVFPFIMRDPNRWSLLVPRIRYWGLHPPPAPLEEVIDNGLLAIQRAIFLKKAGVETAVNDDFLLNPPTRADLLESAIDNIIRYLQACREKTLTSSVKEGVDTLLMYLYRALNRVDEMEKLASAENSCVVEELETLLDESGHLRTLAFLYASKGLSSKALSIWRILARNYSSGLWKDPAPAVETDSENPCTNLTSGKEIAAAEASKILEESSDQDLVLQHLGWIADINQLLAVKILTSEKRVNQLSPGNGIAPLICSLKIVFSEISVLSDEVIAEIDPKKVEILQRYLQWLIEDQESCDTRFHTLYALSVAKSAIEMFELENNNTQSKAGILDESDPSRYGRNSIFESPVRERLQIFLESSDLYDPEVVLDLIEGSELWLEKAILYRKLGQETLVLQILAL
ncbi:Vacuolar sorting protein 39/Transforming growth factor beta receptor-associated domain 1 [Dillenia turbinata]|uniref:Vacuolar sorting protein 39/Transforming growth factor beta receptor-associated domain 1 n=1 Tax=Dillenia turbinata TaxID=194707 RepID=A0AAN8UWT3_9MAGN